MRYSSVAKVKDGIDNEFRDALDTYISELFCSYLSSGSLEDKIVLAAYAVDVTSNVSYGSALKSMCIISGIDFTNIKELKEACKSTGVSVHMLYNIVKLNDRVKNSSNQIVRNFADKIISWSGRV